MKSIITILIFAFAMNANAQDVKQEPKKAANPVSKQEAISSKKTSVTVSGTTAEKSKTVSDEKKSCTVDGSCCGGGKTPPKKS
ncbi:hypothetical protein E0I26_06575 [Flavobacterium rhamnosiphilum]|uniref:Uncharacterized protein n=1 Tax=Flavobacterium rhamnosiphilum TaxID=2541724 RepID=A0A4R5F9P2_9FLAO|nr:hypothetical protein [Flavobacterium rhamnosiphilum]TDE44802.1 hypothetical protein E0I26_06575 [Flavobacterium rhamnosiphilum]